MVTAGGSIATPYQTRESGYADPSARQLPL
jgi:hypothetical protein